MLRITSEKQCTNPKQQVQEKNCVRINHCDWLHCRLEPFAVTHREAN